MIVATVLALLALAGPGLATEPLLVDAATLHAQRPAPDLRVIDMADELADYRRAHIPGAVHLDVEKTRVAVPGRGSRVVAPDEGARLLGALGLTSESRIVVYDDADS